MAQLERRTSIIITILATVFLCVFVISNSLASTPLTITNLKAVNPFFSPNADSVNETSTISYSLSKAAYVTTRVYDSSHQLMKTYMKTVDQGGTQVQELEAVGAHSWIWDGKNDAGMLVPCGVYSLEVNAEDQIHTEFATTTATVTVETSPVYITSPVEGGTIGGVVALSATKSPLILAPYDRVGFKVKAKGGTTWTDIGLATRLADGSYNLAWDSTLNINGEYQFKARLGYVSGSSFIVLDESPVTTAVVDNPIRVISPSFYPTVFSSNSDGRRDTTILSYSLSEPGLATTRIYDMSNVLVRTLENMVSHPAGQTQITWDGKDDAGLFVPSGVYTARIDAVDAGGNFAPEESVGVTVDRSPVTIISPPAGSTLAGTVTLVANISAYVPPSYNTVRFFYQPSPTTNPSYWYAIGSAVKQPDGSFLLSWDTTALVDGAYRIRAETGYFSSGNFLSYELSAPVEVAVDNPIRVISPSFYPTVFSSNSDGRRDTTILSYSLSEPGLATTRIYDMSNVLVRTLENMVSHPAGQTQITWDGKDDAGLFVPSGVYTARIDAVDAGGNFAPEESVGVTVDRSPVTIISPPAGSTLAGTVTLVANISAYVPPSYNTVRFFYQPSPTTNPSYWYAIGSAVKQPDGSFLLSWDTTALVDGAYRIRAETGYFSSGNFLSYELSAPVEVAVDNALPSSVVTTPIEYSYIKEAPILIIGTCADPSPAGVVEKVEVVATNTLTGEVINWQEAILSVDGQNWSYLFTPPTDGRYKIQSRAIDSAGNFETPSAGITLTFDSQPPSTTSNSNSLWHNANVAVTLSSTDNEAGVVKTFYQVDSMSGSWSLGTSVLIPSPSDHSNDGTHTIYYFSEDRAGNIETTKSTEIKIDTAPPETLINLSGMNYGFDPVVIGLETIISLSSTDQGSGVLSTVYRIDTPTDPGLWQSYLGPFSITTGGEHTIYFKSQDNLGQVEQERQLRVNVDVVPPEPPSGLVVTNPQLGGVLNLGWNANIESDIAGYNVYRSEVSQAGYEKLNSTLLALPVYQETSLTNGRRYYYVVTAVDNIGAESFYSAEIAGIPTPPDNTPPIVVSLTPTDGNVLNTPCAFIEARFSDESGSGIDFELSQISVEVNEIPFPGQKIVNEITGTIIFWPDVPFPDNTYTVKATPVDKAQNVGLPQSSTFILDTYIPSEINTLGATPAAGQVVLSWLSPSDMGPAGRAESYVVKQSLSPIYSTADFNSAETVTQALVPQEPGLQETLTVSGLTNGRTYYYVVKSIDGAGNTSQLSNLANATPQPDQVISSIVVSRLDKTALVVGDSTTISVNVKNNGNTATEITSISSDTIWLDSVSPLPITLDPGQEKQLTLTAEPPIDIEPSTYQAHLLISSAGGGSFSTTIPINVQTTGLADLPVKVVNSSTNVPLFNATLVLAAGETVFGRLTTNGIGTAIFTNQMRGTYIVSAYQPGYAPKTVTISIQAGQNDELVIGLEQRQFIMTDLVWRRLELPEIETLVSQGVLSLADPTNYNVYTYQANVTIETGAGSKKQLSSVAAGGYNVSQKPPPGQPDPSPPTYATIVVPVEIKYMKEHFEATMVVRNNADPGIVLKNVKGRLILPTSGGLNFAATTPQQTDEHLLGDIPGGSQKSTSWLLRGDVQGDYIISANLDTEVWPFNEIVSQTVSAQTPIKIYAGSGLKVLNLVPDRVEGYNNFKVKIGLKNDSPISIYYVTITINTSGLRNCVRSPGYSFSKTFQEIKPGQTVWMKSGFISLIDGTTRFISTPPSGGNVNLECSIEVDPSLGPGAQLPLYARARYKSVDLQWQSVLDAVNYRIYRSTDINKLADVSPLTVAAPSSLWTLFTDSGLPPGALQWYCVSYISSTGEEDVVHNITSAIPYDITSDDPIIPERTGRLISSGSLSPGTFNPYNGDVSVAYALIKTSGVRILILDEDGRTAKEIQQGNKGPGGQTYNWTGVIDYLDLVINTGVILAPHENYKIIVIAQDATDPGIQDSLDLGVVSSVYI